MAGGMRGRGVCMTGVCVAGGHAWQGVHIMHAPWRIVCDTVNRGTCMVGRQILRLRYTVNERTVGILLECILVNTGHRRFTLLLVSKSESERNI